MHLYSVIQNWKNKLIERWVYPGILNQKTMKGQKYNHNEIDSCWELGHRDGKLIFKDYNLKISHNFPNNKGLRRLAIFASLFILELIRGSKGSVLNDAPSFLPRNSHRCTAYLKPTQIPYTAHVTKFRGTYLSGMSLLPLSLCFLKVIFGSR